MSILSNHEVAKKFFEVYFKALGPASMDLAEKKFIKIYKRGSDVLPLWSTLPSNLASTAVKKTAWSFFGDLIFKFLGGGLGVATDIVMTYGKKRLQDSSDFVYDRFVEYNMNVIKDVALDAVTKGVIDISKSQTTAALEIVIRDLVFPDFQ